MNRRTIANLPLVLFLALFLAIPLSAGAATEDEVTDEEMQASIQQFLAGLEFRQGAIELDDVNASLALSDSYRFLGAADTERLLVDAWGNPPGMQVLGSIVPETFALVGPESWAIIVTYEEDGYVSDEDAETIDYDEMLASMQSELAASNEARTSQGYASIELVGWAETPYYDPFSHKLHWAKELKFDGEESNTLNYNIRALGRRGVLVLNAVGSMDQYLTVRQGMQDVLEMVSFEAGSTYADFDPSMDEVAAYGIGALVAGKIAAKVGLLAKFAPLLLGLKKFGIIIVAGVSGIAAKFFRRKKNNGIDPIG